MVANIIIIIVCLHHHQGEKEEEQQQQQQGSISRISLSPFLWLTYVSFAGWTVLTYANL
jgi:hypothetical protein